MEIYRLSALSQQQQQIIYYVFFFSNVLLFQTDVLAIPLITCTVLTKFLMVRLAGRVKVPNNIVQS